MPRRSAPRRDSAVPALSRLAALKLSQQFNRLEEDVFRSTLLSLLVVPALALLRVDIRAQEPQPFPAGVYTFEIAASELPGDVPSDIRAMMIGKYVVTFTADGHVTNMVGGKLDAAGRYSSTPGYLVITDEEGPGHCQEERATGIYKWRLDGSTLTLEAVEDLCKWRRFSITLKPWTRTR